MGYHVRNSRISSSIINFLYVCDRSDLISVFDFNVDMPFEERLKYGFPITEFEYKIHMKQIVYFLGNNFKNYKELVL